MPAFPTSAVGLGMDLTGCPNLCRHCYLGFTSTLTLTEDDLRQTAARFREGFREAELDVGELKVLSWIREPDNSDDYRGRYALENELSDGPPVRYELLSVRRVARDPSYAKWASEVGPDACQITFFGLEETNDWFYQRPGSFQAYLAATERLLDVGIKPRWQFFFTKKIVPDIDGLFGLVDRMRLRERVAELGGTFNCFIHTPGPDGAAMTIEHLRPTPEDVASIPKELVEMTETHLGHTMDWRPERDRLNEIIEKEHEPPAAYAVPQMLWFQVKSNWDVYTNIGVLDPWWRLGNLKIDSVATILRRLHGDACLGLEVNNQRSPADLAKEYGNPSGQGIYDSNGDLSVRHLTEHCRRLWKDRRRQPFTDGLVWDTASASWRASA